MKLITLPKEDARRAVLGFDELLNVPLHTDYSGIIVIHTSGAMLGCVRVTRGCEPDGTDLPGAAGPWCLILEPRCVFDEPVPYVLHRPKHRQLVDAPEDVNWNAIVAAAMPPRAWLDRQARQNPQPIDLANVYPPSGPDGWQGD